MRRTDQIRARLRSLFLRRRVEHELDAELQFHLEQQIEEGIAAGMNRADAEAAARRALGSVAYVKEACRESLGVRLVDELTQDLRHTGRNLVKTPAFTITAILILALGIGANATVFTLLDAVLFKPLPVPGANELVGLYENGPEGPADPIGGTGRYLRFSYPRFERLRQAVGSRGSMAAVTRSSQFTVRLPGNSEPRFLQAQLVSGEYFSTLGVSAARGRTVTPDDVSLDRLSAVAVISDGFWKRMLGGANTAMGEVLTINGLHVTVIGVAPPGFVGLWTDREPDAWLPLTLQRPLHYENNSSSYGRIDSTQPWLSQDLVAWLNVFARVHPEERDRLLPALQAANHAGLALLAGTFENPKGKASMLAHTLAIEPLSRGFSVLRTRYVDTLFALAGMGALVLLVTCANIANLLLARAPGRARDVGIRLALGATTGRLVRQYLVESLTLALLGGGTGLLLGAWASGLLAHQVLGSGQLPPVFSPDTRFLIFGASVSLITAVVFGLAPALRAVQIGHVTALGTNQRQAVGQATNTGMRSLVAGQLGLSVVLVFVAILLGRTLINFTRLDPGFSTDHLVTVSFDPIVSGYTPTQIAALGDRLVEAASRIPGVTSVVASSCGLVAGCASSGGIRIEGIEDAVTVSRNWVGPRYFATVGIPLVAGREFDQRDGADAPVAIVNESIARRYFPGQSAIGRRLGSQRDREIVGVVRDAQTQSLHEPPAPMVYFPLDPHAAMLQSPLTNVDVRVAGDAQQVVSAVRDAIRRAEPNLLLSDVAPMSARLARDLSRERLVAYLAVSFGLLTLLLGSIGLYGVLSHTVARRTQEIGVRMALGARSLEVVRLVLGQSVGVATAGVVLGFLGTVAGTRYLSGMLFGVSALDPTTVLMVFLTFTLTTLGASCLPAWRATRVDPLVALQSE